MQKLLLTMKEAEGILQIGHTKLWTLVAREEIPSIRFGRSVRIPVYGLLEYIGAPASALTASPPLPAALPPAQPALPRVGAPQSRQVVAWLEGNDRLVIDLRLAAALLHLSAPRSSPEKVSIHGQTAGDGPAPPSPLTPSPGLEERLALRLTVIHVPAD